MYNKKRPSNRGSDQHLQLINIGSEFNTDTFKNLEQIINHDDQMKTLKHATKELHRWRDFPDKVLGILQKLEELDLSINDLDKSEIEKSVNKCKDSFI